MEYELGNDTGFGTRRLRLSTINNTRWLAIAGQLAAVLFVATVLHFQLPIIACLFLIALAAILNLALTRLFPTNKRLRPVGVFAVLIFDVAQLSGLLALTGGLTNPFCILLVVPVIISATTLPPRTTTVAFSIGSLPSPVATVAPVIARSCARAGSTRPSRSVSPESSGMRRGA